MLRLQAWFGGWVAGNSAVVLRQETDASAGRLTKDRSKNRRLGSGAKWPLALSLDPLRGLQRGSRRADPVATGGLADCDPVQAG